MSTLRLLGDVCLPFLWFLPFAFPLTSRFASAAEDDAAKPGRASCCGAASCRRPLPPLPPQFKSGVRLLSVFRSCAAASFCTMLATDCSEADGAGLAVSHHDALKPVFCSRHFLYASRRNSSSYEREVLLSEELLQDLRESCRVDVRVKCSAPAVGKNVILFRSASVLVSTSICTLIRFDAISTFENSRLCGIPPALRSMPMSEATLRSSSGASASPVNVSRSFILRKRSARIVLSSSPTSLRRCSNAS